MGCGSSTPGGGRIAAVAVAPPPPPPPAPAPPPPPPPPPPRFRGPAADSALGELLLDVLPIAAAVGFALDLRRARFLCGATFRAGDKGATNDMLVRSLARQCAWHAAARAEPRRAHDGLQRTTQLIRAALLGDAARARALLALGADPDARSEYGCTALHWACSKGHVAVVRALVSEGGGAEPEEAGSEVGERKGPEPGPGRGEGPAARGGGPGRADASLRSQHGLTPLMYAARVGSEPCARALLLEAPRGGAAGCAIDAQNRDGDTALTLAAFKGRAAVVELLVAAGAALELRDAAGETALHKAASAGHVAVLEALRAAGADLEARDRPLGRTALGRAVLQRQLPAARALVLLGADARAADADGRAPLHLACVAGDLAALQLLLDAAADAAARDRKGATAARIARDRGHAALVAELEAREEARRAREEESAAAAAEAAAAAGAAEGGGGGGGEVQPPAEVAAA